MKRTDIVTKDSLRDRLENRVPTFVDEYPLNSDEVLHYVIGRALATIYKAQTADERSQSNNSRDSARHRNGVGFAKNDARIGPIGARMFNTRMIMQTAFDQLLDPWVLKIWSDVDATGYPRICKYASQLNDIALAKRESKQMRQKNPHFLLQDGHKLPQIQQFMPPDISML